MTKYRNEQYGVVLTLTPLCCLRCLQRSIRSAEAVYSVICPIRGYDGCHRSTCFHCHATISVCEPSVGSSPKVTLQCPAPEPARVH